MEYRFENSIGKLSMLVARSSGKLLEFEFRKEGIDINPSEWTCFAFINHYQKITQKELASRTGIDKVSINRLIKKLQAKNYVEKTIDTYDKRKQIINLTNEGLKIYKSLKKIAGESLGKVYEKLDSKDFETCQNVLKQILSNLNNGLSEEY
ncbi:MAG: MarR family transcriptional regulator [Bacteroidales bacterium]|nr:MarR family transcriptional regulator [Bacteroidales bacterium]